jgi:hypothetical protein
MLLEVEKLVARGTYAYFSLEIPIDNGAATLEDCIMACDNDRQCQIARFNTVTKTCTLADTGTNGCSAFVYAENPDYDSSVIVQTAACPGPGACSGS